MSGLRIAGLSLLNRDYYKDMVLLRPVDQSCDTFARPDEDRPVVAMLLVLIEWQTVRG